MVALVKKTIRSLLGEKRISKLHRWQKSIPARLRLYKSGWRYWPIMRYLEIDGWLTVDEAKLLYDLSLSMPENSPVLVEIGSWQGKSSFILAKGVLHLRKPTLYCIDPFDASGDDVSLVNYAGRQAGLQDSLRGQFERNMHKNQVASVIKVLQGYSNDVRKTFDQPIDFLFIDGNHDYQFVLQDYHDWTPLLKQGGLIAFHDVVRKDSVPGPLRVVEQKILNNPDWKTICWVDSLYIAQKVN